MVAERPLLFDNQGLPAETSWPVMLAIMDAPSDDKASCSQCGHIATLGTVDCSMCSVVMDNAPLTVAKITEQDNDARERLFQEPGLVLNRKRANFSCIGYSSSHSWS